MFDLTKNLKDASYVLIGLGVIGYQKASEQGQQLRARLDSQRVQLDKQVEETRTQLTKLATERLDTLQERLPVRAKELVTRFTGASAAA